MMAAAISSNAAALSKNTHVSSANIARRLDARSAERHTPYTPMLEVILSAHPPISTDIPSLILSNAAGVRSEIPCADFDSDDRMSLMMFAIKE